jgi:hypothetical protein
MRRKNGSSSYDTKATFEAISTNAIEVISNKTTFEATKAIATFEATKAIEDINTKTASSNALGQRVTVWLRGPPRPFGHLIETVRIRGLCEQEKHLL